MSATTTAEPILDRSFAEKFLTAVDRPFDYSVYFLFHDFWAEAPDEAIEQYHADLLAMPGAREFIDEQHLAEPLTMENLVDCAPGTLGAGYHEFIVGNGLMENLGKDFKAFHAGMKESGALDRLPADLSYMIVRGFQIHDFTHVLTGFGHQTMGELSQAGFHYAQLRFPYHAMRFAVTLGHLAFITPSATVDAMDSLVAGWTMGRAAQNVHFTRWEDELDTPLADIRERFGIVPAGAS